jgi:RimJ/RimL family protein N-acetyltransferase
MPGPVFIEGERIELRTVERADVEFLQRGVNHPDVRRHIGTFRTPYNHERYEEECFESIDSDGDGASLLVCPHEREDPVGSVQLYPVDHGRGWANLGVWIVPDAREAGYATEACELVVEYGFDGLRLHRISGVAVTPNVASRQLLESLGFTHEGTNREDAFVDGEYVGQERYGLLEDEWTS